jgi:hypothetical protein
MMLRTATAALLLCAMLLPLGATRAVAVESMTAPIAPLLPTPTVVEIPALAAFESTWPAVAAYSTTVTIFEQKGAQVLNSAFEYTFRKPSNATVYYPSGQNAGVTLVWSGGSTVVGHRGSGLLALFKKTYSLHDPILLTIRGSSIDQLSFAAIFAHTQAIAGTMSQGAGPTIAGNPTEAVTLVPSSSAADTGLTREVVYISTMLNLPIRVLGYEGTTLVRQVDFSNIKLLR